MLAIASAAVFVVYGFITFDGDRRDRLSAIVNAAGLAVAVAVVYLTYHSVAAARESVRASRESVAEMKAAREAGDAPRIVVYPVMTNGARVDVIIENVGRSPATNVLVVAADRDDKQWPVPGGAWPQAPSTRLLGPGIYLPSGSAVRRVIMSGRSMDAQMEHGFSRVDVTCSWEWPDGGGRRFTAVSTVDPSILLDRERVVPVPISLRPRAESGPAKDDEPDASQAT